jgi:hypothetical protein
MSTRLQNKAGSRVVYFMPAGASIFFARWPASCGASATLKLTSSSHMRRQDADGDVPHWPGGVSMKPPGEMTEAEA